MMIKTPAPEKQCRSIYLPSSLSALGSASSKCLRNSFTLNNFTQKNFTLKLLIGAVLCAQNIASYAQSAVTPSRASPELVNPFSKTKTINRFTQGDGVGSAAESCSSPKASFNATITANSDANPNSVNYGDVITMVFEASNKGPCATQDLAFDVQLPARYQLLSWQCRIDLPLPSPGRDGLNTVVFTPPAQQSINSIACMDAGGSTGMSSAAGTQIKARIHNSANPAAPVLNGKAIALWPANYAPNFDAKPNAAKLVVKARLVKYKDLLEPLVTTASLNNQNGTNLNANPQTQLSQLGAKDDGVVLLGKTYGSQANKAFSAFVVGTSDSASFDKYIKTPATGSTLNFETTITPANNGTFSHNGLTIQIINNGQGIKNINFPAATLTGPTKYAYSVSKAALVTSIEPFGIVHSFTHTAPTIMGDFDVVVNVLTPAAQTIFADKVLFSNNQIGVGAAISSPMNWTWIDNKTFTWNADITLKNYSKRTVESNTSSSYALNLVCSDAANKKATVLVDPLPTIRLQPQETKSWVMPFVVKAVGSVIPSTCTASYFYIHSEWNYVCSEPTKSAVCGVIRLDQASIGSNPDVNGNGTAEDDAGSFVITAP
jgi:hypothetical protein